VSSVSQFTHYAVASRFGLAPIIHQFYRFSNSRRKFEGLTTSPICDIL
jgi:hypothetical protein